MLAGKQGVAVRRSLLAVAARTDKVRMKFEVAFGPLNDVWLCLRGFSPTSFRLSFSCKAPVRPSLLKGSTHGLRFLLAEGLLPRSR